MITILHNPRCSTSRAALEALQSAGVDFDEVRYLDAPLNETAVSDLIDILEDPFADLVRRDATFDELGLGDDDVATRDKVAALLADNPRLMQRPVLIAEKSAIIGRPKDRVPTFIEQHGSTDESATTDEQIRDNAEEEEAAIHPGEPDA